MRCAELSRIGCCVQCCLLLLAAGASQRLAEAACGLKHGCVQSCITLCVARCMLRMLMGRSALLHWTTRGRTPPRLLCMWALQAATSARAIEDDRTDEINCAQGLLRCIFTGRAMGRSHDVGMQAYGPGSLEAVADSARQGVS